MSFATIVISGYNISIVGIALLIFQVLITYFLGNIKGFGVKRSSGIGGWTTSIVGLVTLTLANVFPVSQITLVFSSIFALFAIVAILLSVITRDNPSHYNGIFGSIFVYIPVIGIIIGILFSIANMILI